MTTWADARNELRKMRDLKDDWDGEGTAAPDLEIVIRAVRVAEYLDNSDYPPPDRVHVTVNATICFEWHREGVYQEAEVVSDWKVEWRWCPRETPANARFIAAAPEMLAACQTLVGLPGTEDWLETLRKAVQEARNAIAKVEGTK